MSTIKAHLHVLMYNMPYDMQVGDVYYLYFTCLSIYVNALCIYIIKEFFSNITKHSSYGWIQFIGPCGKEKQFHVHNGVDNIMI